MKTKEIATFRKSYKDYDKQCYFEGFKLAVMFDEKDAVKKWGARWNADGGFWWMPASKLLDQVHDNGTLVRDWLNDSEMIMGQYGEIKNTERFNDVAETNYTEYGLHKSNNEPQFKVQFFFNEDVAKFIPTGMGELASEYLTIEDGRKRWDEAIANGYNRVDNS